MEKINELPDDVLVKILSFLPTKKAVSTCVLSKRWEFLWMWLPKLEFLSPYGTEGDDVLGDFINKKLPLHKSPFIESLRLVLHLNDDIKPEDVKRWIEISVSHHVRELDIRFHPVHENIIPCSLFTCKSLVTLKLNYVVLMDVPSMVCFPSLKTFQLKTVDYVNGKSLQDLLSICPVLDDLSVQIGTGAFTIIVLTLQSLTLLVDNCSFLDGYEVDTPSLKYLKLEDMNEEEHYSLIKNMPKLREAVSLNPKSLIASITSVKRLTICCLEGVYGDGFVFNQLEHLNLCVCKEDVSHVLGQLLKDSPNLRVLNISLMHNMFSEYCVACWNQPSSVPECPLSSLQILTWTPYIGGRHDSDIAVYNLKNARHLKMRTILADSPEDLAPNLKELILSPLASSTCQLSIR
ncbi:PREDICTED: FBD-associated F-box protein At5g38590-like [Camelina sativa]|uniref:FBD-associated F-box protein At5g38590-like n=1 Tax=Camelina sativa TaxID=90675 RepID=A0ABM0V6X1_CAMSA|nr:PREDICTED: FBD-associated F-box protein At5g38590-like [Camelina sativa]